MKDIFFLPDVLLENFQNSRSSEHRCCSSWPTCIFCLYICPHRSSGQSLLTQPTFFHQILWSESSPLHCTIVAGTTYLSIFAKLTLFRFSRDFWRLISLNLSFVTIAFSILFHCFICCVAHSGSCIIRHINVLYYY